MDMKKTSTVSATLVQWKFGWPDVDEFVSLFWFVFTGDRIS